MGSNRDLPTPQGPVDPQVDRVLGELSHVLWQLRDLTTNLVYRLEVQQLVLVSGRVRWINHSAEDVERAIEATRRQELVRSRLVQEVAPMLGTSPEASLRELCTAAPPPWDLVLAEHQSDFLRLANEAEDVARDNRDLLHQGLSEVRQFLNVVGGQGAEGSAGDAGYGARAGRAAPTQGSAAVLVDREA